MSDGAVQQRHQETPGGGSLSPLLAKLKEGQKMGFEFVQEGDDYVVT